MREVAEEVLKYFQDNLFVTLVIAFIAGFAGTKTVAFAKKGNPALYFIVGVLGAFLGQFAILYFGLKEILDQLPAFRLIFDLLAAYIGSFIVAWIIHLFQPH